MIMVKIYIDDNGHDVDRMVMTGEDDNDHGKYEIKVIK